MNRIQLVEADAKHEKVLRSQLEGHGFHVIPSSDIEDARKKLHELVPDLIVISLNINDTLFFEFYRWLCHNFPWSKIPRLFISGDKLTEIARELEIEETEEIFSRPLDIARFIATIKELLSSRGRIFKKQDEDYLAAVPGRKIGSVILKEEIGRGGMGAVFLGYQEILERKVAVKLLLPDKIGDPYAAQRFQREAVAIAGLKSPHIVQVFDFGEIDHNVFYICMEYLEGRTLEQYLEEKGKLPAAEAAAVVSQVAEGLVAAHDAGMVHRDIKPSNLILNPDNHVTITDFGLVRPQKKTEQTQSDAIVGSPHYMSPEQASGETMDLRSDIYSLGIIFFRLVTGKVPFTAENPIKILLQHINNPLPDPRHIIPEIPGRVAGIIKRMSEKKQQDRYPDCRELLKDLESLVVPDDRAIALSSSEKQTPAVPPVAERITAAGFEKKFLELSSLLPSLFSREKLLATMTMSPSGAVLKRQGEFPPEWKDNLYLLQENISQVNAAANLGQWRFLIVNSTDNLAILYPEDSGIEVLFLSHCDNEVISKTAFFENKRDQQKQDTVIDPVRQLAAIAGVHGVFLFNRDGELAVYRQTGENTVENYRLRLSPAALIIQSVSLEISSLDLWFEKGRVLIWKINTALVFVIADPHVGYSILSLFVSSNSMHLERAAQTKTPPTPDFGQQFRGTAPPSLLERMQLEFVRMIGPVGKVVFDKALHHSGCAKEQFPFSRIPELVEELAKKIGPDERQKFTDKIRNLISDSGDVNR